MIERSKQKCGPSIIIEEARIIGSIAASKKVPEFLGSG
jgi:hypothetical protein